MKSKYSNSPYGRMRDKIAERKEKGREKEVRKRFPYKYCLAYN